MRISDWSSDVCSSDLAPTSTVDSPLQLAVRAALTERSGPLHAVLALVGSPDAVAERAAIEHPDQLTQPPGSLGRLERSEERRVGKECVSTWKSWRFAVHSKTKQDEYRKPRTTE